MDVDFSLQLAYAASSGTINEFGTGLGGLPGTTVEDMFVSFGEKGTIEVYEICRILGPFPSVRNKLDGTFEFKKKAAGFAGEAVNEEGLYVKYTQLTDGRDKVRLCLGHQHFLGPAPLHLFVLVLFTLFGNEPCHVPLRPSSMFPPSHCFCHWPTGDDGGDGLQDQGGSCRCGVCQ
jgi:hypothetical protein